MSVPVQTPYKKYTAAPGATVFPTTFRVVLAGDLQVRVDTVVVTSGFTLSALGAPSGLDVTFTAPMVGGEVVELQRIIPKSRVNDYQQLGDFNASTVNADIDRTWMSIQELGEEVDRSVKVPIGSTIDPDQLIADLLAVQAAAEASADDADADRQAAQAAAAAAAASAATTGLPALAGKALNLLRVKADETGYETRTLAQVQDDITSLPILPGYIFGLTMDPNGGSATMSIAAGRATDGTGLHSMALPASMDKTTAAFAAGSGNGGRLGVAAVANNTWYDWYLLENLTTGDVEVGFDLVGVVTYPAGFTVSRRIGSGYTNGSGQWTDFFQIGDNFYWRTLTVTLSVVVGTTASNQIVLVPPGVPVLADFNVNANLAAASGYLLISSPQNTTIAATFSLHNVPVTNAGTTQAMPQRMSVMTDALAQIKVVSSVASTNFNLSTNGWTDPRGRNE